MLFSIKSILLVGISVLFFAAAFGDKAFSYEDIEKNRRIFITQNGDTVFSVTDGASHDFEEEFKDTEATPYAVAAAVTRVEFKEAVDAYIDAHIGVVAGVVTPKLARLGMDSALYAYRQENIIFDGKKYQIHYVLLIQSQGDYVVLERRLIPENPTFIAAYHIGQNTGDNYLPVSIQPRGQNKLILALTDENGAATQIRQSATITVTSSVASSVSIKANLTQTLTTENYVTVAGVYTELTVINEYSYISTSLIVSYRYATAILIVGDHIKLDGNAYHPSKSGIINFSDAHRCVIGNHDTDTDHITDTNGLQYYDLTTGVGTLQVARAICPATGTNLKDIVSTDAALSLGEVEGLIYVVVDNFSSPFPELEVLAISGFVNTNTAAVSCGYFENDIANYVQAELAAKFIPHAYISYYWVNPRTWDSQLLRTKKFVWGDANDSGIKEIAEATKNILNKTVAIRFIAQVNGSETVPAGNIILPVDWADVAEGQVVTGQFHDAANFSLSAPLPAPALITYLDLGAAKSSSKNITIITNGKCKGKDYHCWGSTDENANLNSGFLHDLMMRVQLSIVACGNNNYKAQIITEVGGPTSPGTDALASPSYGDSIFNRLRVPTKLDMALSNKNSIWKWDKTYGKHINKLNGPPTPYIANDSLRPNMSFVDYAGDFKIYIGGLNPPEIDLPGCSGDGEIHSPPPNSWVFPIVSTGKCANLDKWRFYLALSNDQKFLDPDSGLIKVLVDLKP